MNAVRPARSDGTHIRKTALEQRFMRLGRALDDQKGPRPHQEAAPPLESASRGLVRYVRPNVEWRVAGDDIEIPIGKILAEVAWEHVHVGQAVLNAWSPDMPPPRGALTSTAVTSESGDLMDMAAATAPLPHPRSS